MSEITVENRSILIGELKKVRQSSTGLSIGIDGVNGSGKTNLAHYVASELVVDAIHLDFFLVHRLDCYLKALNSGLLMHQLQLQQDKTFVIEGCCLLDVAEMLDIKLGILIYCKEISRDTKIWHYGNNFDEYATSSCEASSSNLDKELLEYHRRVRPWEKAQFTYCFFNELKGR